MEVLVRPVSALTLSKSCADLLEVRGLPDRPESRRAFKLVVVRIEVTLLTTDGSVFTDPSFFA